MGGGHLPGQLVAALALNHANALCSKFARLHGVSDRIEKERGRESG